MTYGTRECVVVTVHIGQERCLSTELRLSCKRSLVRFLIPKNVLCAALLNIFLEMLCGLVLVMLSSSA